MPVPRGRGGLSDRHDFGVSGRVLMQLAFVAAAADHRAGGIQNHRADGHIVGGESRTRLVEGQPHPFSVPTALRIVSVPHAAALPTRSIEPMRVHVADHPLITHKLTVLRDKNTSSPMFRALVEELMTLLAYEGTRGVRVEDVTVETPVAIAHGVKISDPKPLIVPILRAGLGMLEGMVKLLPSAEVGFLGMARNEETLEPTTYAERLPDDLSDRQCFVLDPMLATGGSLIAAIEFLFERGAVDVTAICILAAPEGLAAVEKALAGREVNIVLGAVDDHLNEHGYIIPGLGDAGDRLYGLV
jgi:uracil phosphoribosyltransferase